MTASPTMPRPVKQVLQWGPHHRERFSPPDTQFAQTGRRIYVMGDIDGRFRPRSNPYDLHTFGKPLPGDPLAEKLQGVWAQPVKGLSRYAFLVERGAATWRLDKADSFMQSFAFVEFHYNTEQIQAVRHDFAALDLPILFTTLTLTNTGPARLELGLVFEAEFDLQDAWFTHAAAQRNTDQALAVEDGRLVARANLLPERWAAAAGSLPGPQEARADGDNLGRMRFAVLLEPGSQETFVFGIAIDSQGGAPGATALLDANLSRWQEIFQEKQSLYERLFETGPRLISPEPDLNAAFAIARANLQMLEAETALGRYFYAGLEIFPFWFSNDGAYSLPGLMAGGFRESALRHTRIGLDHLGNGRVPHQISPAGHVAFAGNAQETPLWVLSAWDAYRWTGDRDFLSSIYPGAKKGMFDYVLGEIDPDGDGYPSGPGMVEVEGMGAEKLDSAAYTWSALRALARMAEELGDSAGASRAQERAGAIAARFDADWWDEASGTYAMSLTDPGNARYPLPHWAVVVPLETGLATPEHAARTFSTLRRDYLNRWGLKHTAGEDERVWTLPTVTLSRAAYHYGEKDLGESMLRRLAETLQHGPAGLFHELIPEGACIIQLWSAATFIRGIVEDLLGIEVNAAGHSLEITPRLPDGWQAAGLAGLAFGEHTVRVEYRPGRVEVQHLEGSRPLHVTVDFPSGRRAAARVEAHQQAALLDKTVP